MNDAQQQIVSYLQQYKGQYSQEQLTGQARSNGFTEEDIAAASATVYGDSVDQTMAEQEEGQELGPQRGKFARSWALMKSSLRLLSADKEIVLFPIMASIASVLALVGLFLPFAFFTGILASFTNIEQISTAAIYLIIFVYYLITYFIVAFFNSALVASVKLRIDGGNPTFSSGMKSAFDHIGKIFLWALIAATVGLVLRIILDQIAQRLGVVGQMITSVIVGIIGFAWGVATYFVVPVIIIEDITAKDAIKKSAALFKKTWGENLIGNVGLGLFFALMVIPAVLILFAVAFTLQSVAGAIVCAVLLILFLVAISIIASAMQGIFMTVLYLYATTGKVAEGFDADVVKGAFTQKKKTKSFGLSS